MGSGSSRGGRALRRLRGPGGSAPEGGTGPRDSAGAPEEVPEAAPPAGRDETLRLLDQLLAESAAWAPGEPAPRRPARPSAPAAGAGSPVPPECRAEDHPEGSGAPQAPGSSHKRPERQSVIEYDCSEEELMASIEQEYCH